MNPLGVPGLLVHEKLPPLIVSVLLIGHNAHIRDVLMNLVNAGHAGRLSGALAHVGQVVDQEFAQLPIFVVPEQLHGSLPQRRIQAVRAASPW